MARFAIMLIVLVLSTTARAADGAPGRLWVDDFDDVQNHLGGYRNPFQRAPSRVLASRVADEFHGARASHAKEPHAQGPHARGRSVRIQGHRAADGFCGYWLQFFDFKARDKKYLDTRPYNFLSFWVKGDRGGESFLIKLADRRWIEKDDSLAVGPVSTFLPGGVTTQWREVLVPLDLLHNLQRHEMGGLTIEFDTPGDQVIYLDDVCFKTKARSPAPRHGTMPVASGAGQVPRKIWVWKSEAVLLDDEAGDALLDFCAGQRIDEIWMQLLYLHERLTPSTHAAKQAVTIRYPRELRDFLRRAHARRVRVHALDGAAHYSQRAHHWIPLAVVDGVITFNQGGAAVERFDGIHFDNEPYLLLGWSDPTLREEILLEFLELNAECQRRVRDRSRMKFGIDIPFWWQEHDARTGRAIGDVEFRGKRQAASFHCIEMLDNVGVMNYRDTADGADGMIAHGRGLLAFADVARRATVLMGAETFQTSPVPVCFAVGLPRETFFAALRDSAESLARSNSLFGFRLQTIDDGENVHVGIEIPPECDPSRKRDARRALLQLARQAGIRSRADNAPATASRRAAEFVEANAEWSGFQTMRIEDRETAETYPGFRVTRTMLSKITFADDAPRRFASEIAAAETYFARYKSFGGMAIHYYETFRELVDAQGQQASRAED